MLPVAIGSQFKFGEKGIDEVFPNIGTLVSTIIPNILAISAIVLFLFILIGGVAFVFGAGNDDPKKAEQGKQAITYAIFGFLIIFSAYWIIRMVEKIFGFQIFQSGL